MRRLGMAARRWLVDVIFGIRLAVGSGRSPWGRLTLTAVGIGLGAAVLLSASSVQAIIQNSAERSDAREVSILQPEDGPPALLAATGVTEFRGAQVSMTLLDPQVPDAPVPPGLSRLPGPGEAVVSPEVARLLDSPGGDQLRPRLGERVVGVIGDEGLRSPNELFFYQGTDALTLANSQSQGVLHHFGEQDSGSAGDNPEMRILLVLGVTALLVPIVVFISATSRFAENTRQRRLAALRLVGASGRQVRRIASGESLIGSLLGVVLGWALYLTARAIATSESGMNLPLYSADVQPTWWCAVLVTVGIPLIAVGTAVGSMRRTVIEPLGVVREIVTKPRKLVWRCVPIVVGILGLLAAGAPSLATIQSAWLVASVVLILAGVPLLLPWVVERSVRSLGRGSISWQLAVRRLQLTSGTAARSVSAIAVVLTGVIALQTTVASFSTARLDVGAEADTDAQGLASVSVSGSVRSGTSSDAMARDLGALPGVAEVTTIRTLELEADDGTRASAVVLDCAMLRSNTLLDRCRGGDAFSVSSSTDRVGAPQAGTWHVDGVPTGPDLAEVHLPPPRPITLDDTADLAKQEMLTSGALVLTPALVAGVPELAFDQRTSVRVDPTSAGAVEGVRNVAAEHLLVPSVQSTAMTEEAVRSVNELFRGIQFGLLIGTLITFGLITCGLFVTAAEQVQERRRPMSVLGAVGTRPQELAWSLLLQNALPMLAAVVVSVVLGLVLGGLIVLLTGSSGFAVDIVGMVGLVGVAVVSVLVVTALTLPVVGNAMRPEWLRTE